MSEKTFSNILYLTSACQLSCKYCYEAEKRKQLKEDFWITDNQVKEALDFFKEKKDNMNILFFGGEPLLAWDKIELAVSYVFSEVLKNQPNTSFGFDIITNGIKLSDLEFYNKFFNLFENKYPRSDLKLEISYDGTGQDERTFPNGSPSKHLVDSVLGRLDQDNKEFFLRYTLNTRTYDILEEELIYLFEKYKNLSGITINVAAADLDKIEGNYGKSVKKKAPYILGIYEMYKKPLCDFACQLCRKCIPTDFNMHYVPGIGNKISKKDQKGFDRWNPLLGEDYESERYDIEGRSIGTHV